jgi:hypothetical protein
LTAPTEIPRGAQLAPGQVAPDPAQPGAEGVVVAQAVEPEQGLQHGLLGRVGRAVAGPQQRRAVLLDQRREGGAVAGAGGMHERGGHLLIVPLSYQRVTRPLPSWRAG